MNCENCELPHKYLFYKQNEAAMAIIKVCNKKIPHFNNDIINKVLSFIDYYGSYSVFTEAKRRIPFPKATGDPEKDADLEERIDDWHCDGGAEYIFVKRNLCRQCFISSLLCCYKRENCLPFLRMHFRYFEINKKDILIDEDEIQKASRKLVLPSSYDCRFYRKQIPIDLNDNKLIYLNKFK